MAQKTEVSGMDDEKLKRVGTICGWVVAVPLIYFSAAPFWFLLLLELPQTVSESSVMELIGGITLTPGIYLYVSVEFYGAYCDWVVGF